MAAVSIWTPGTLFLTGGVTAPSSPNGFVYKATQAGSGTTGTTEPVWPLIAGNTVADGTVTWEAVTATAITWRAVPIYKSGAGEPSWPTSPGGLVVDGTITWQCTTYHVADSKCPNTKQVVIAGSKVFAGARDVVRYSATSNPLDWSTANDAGFLPTGLQAQVDPIVQALGIYRSNLTVWSAGEFQVWQVDPDPSRMALVDSMPSIGTTYYRGAASVSGDLYFTTKLGVRSVTIAGGSTNLQAGDIGTPIDELVQPALVGQDPIGLFVPSAGQFWLAVEAEVFVYTTSRIGGIGAWGIYDLPGPLDAYTQVDGDLYLRIGDRVYVRDTESVLDGDQPMPEQVIQWPYLALGQENQQKMLVGLDVTGTGDRPMVSIGYDQTNDAAFTPPFEYPADTVPGYVQPMPVSGPSFSLKLTYQGGEQPWELLTASLYMNDMRLTA